MQTVTASAMFDVMDNCADMENRLLGTRDPEAREAETLGAMLTKARELGFSEAELQRLAACYQSTHAARLGKSSDQRPGDAD